MQNQRSGINSLKEEVRGSSQSVASEVKKIKSCNDICWRFEGNRLQFEFSSKVADSLTQTLWGLRMVSENMPLKYLMNPVTNSRPGISTSGLLIPLKEAGKLCTSMLATLWLVTLKTRDVSAEPNRAQSRRRKTQQKPKPKTKASVAYGYTDSLNQRLSSGMASASVPFLPRIQSQTVGPRISSFCGYPADQRSTFNVGLCFACDEPNHIRHTCPITKGAVQQQSDAIVKKWGRYSEGFS